jgi:hypothetical protein
MLIKSKDHSEKAIQELETIKQLPDLPEDMLANIERELKTMKAGSRGEEDAAYYIDFHYRTHQNWAVIHDLRIEYDGNVAQIDHLLINRLFEFYILETKNFTYGLKITDHGEFLFWNKNRYVAFPSPIEQNNRHTLVLERFLKNEDILPKRLGIGLRPSFKPYVLVSPKTSVNRPDSKKFNTNMVIKSDELFRQIQEDADKANLTEIFSGLAKLISTETLVDFANRLVSYHKPASIDYYAKFGVQRIKETAIPEKKQATSTEKHYFCSKCKKPISEKAAIFCFTNKQRFHGKAYCFDCQKTV